MIACILFSILAGAVCAGIVIECVSSNAKWVKDNILTFLGVGIVAWISWWTYSALTWGALGWAWAFVATPVTIGFLTIFPPLYIILHKLKQEAEDSDWPKTFFDKKGPMVG